MAYETQPTTIRVSTETYQKLLEYADKVYAKDISTAVRFFLLTFLETPDRYPNIDNPSTGKNLRQTTIAIEFDMIEQLKDIASKRNVSLAYLLRLVIFYGLKGSE